MPLTGLDAQTLPVAQKWGEFKTQLIQNWLSFPSDRFCLMLVKTHLNQILNETKFRFWWAL